MGFANNTGSLIIAKPSGWMPVSYDMGHRVKSHCARIGASRGADGVGLSIELGRHRPPAVRSAPLYSSAGIHHTRGPG